MNKVINFNRDNDRTEGFDISLSDELKAEAQALSDYILQLPLSCEDNNKLINMVFEHMQHLIKESFAISIGLDIELLEESSINE